MKKHLGDVPRDFKCELCPKAFQRRTCLVSHQKTHTVVEKNFECEVCLEKFATISTLKIHATRHSDDRPFTCVQCGKGFKYGAALNLHVQINHAVSRDFECEVCHKRFSIKKYLVNHRR